MAGPITWQNITSVTNRDANYAMSNATAALEKAMGQAQQFVQGQEARWEKNYNEGQDQQMLALKELISGAKTSDDLSAISDQVAGIRSGLSTSNRAATVDWQTKAQDALKARAQADKEYELTQTNLEMQKNAFERQKVENQDYWNTQAERPMLDSLRAKMAAGDFKGAESELNDYSKAVTLANETALRREITQGRQAAEDRRAEQEARNLRNRASKAQIKAGEDNAAIRNNQLLAQRFAEEAAARKAALRDQGVTGTDGYMSFGDYKEVLTNIRELQPDVDGDKLAQVAKGLFSIQELFQKQGKPLPKDVVLKVALGATDNFAQWNEGLRSDIVRVLRDKADEVVMVDNPDGTQVAANRWMRDYELNAAVDAELGNKNFDNTVQLYSALNIPLTDAMQKQLSKRKAAANAPKSSKIPASQQQAIADSKARTARLEAAAKAAEVRKRLEKVGSADY